MDKTPEYIEMCEKAEEIQARWLAWNDRQGAWFTPKTNMGSTDEWDNSHMIPMEDGTELEFGKVYCSGDLVDFSASGLSDFVTILREEDMNLVIFLPRQDQLQEMIRGSDSVSDYGLIHRLNHFIYGKDGESDFTLVAQGCRSIEQLWLAFVMKECYNKVWQPSTKTWEVTNDSTRLGITKA